MFRKVEKPVEVWMVLCTFPDLEQARQIGTVLVEKQLAACVNVLPGVVSIYRWQGKIEREEEVLAIFKTTAEGVERLEKSLVEAHPYEVPEVVALRPERVAEAYGKWVGECVGS